MDISLQNKDISSLHKAILDNAGYAIIVTDTQGIITLFNRASEKLLGFSSEELVGTHTPQVFHLESEVVERAKQYSKELKKNIEPGFDVFVIKSQMGLPNTYEWTYITKNGKPIPVLLSVTTIRNELNEISGYLGIAADISTQKAVEKELINSREQLNEAQRIAKLGSWSLNLQNNHLEWSDEIFRLFEVNPKKFKASYDCFINAIHPNDRELVNQTYQDSLKTQKPYEITHRLLFDDGRIKYVNEACETSFDENGKPLLSQGTVQDITEKKLSEEKISLYANVFKHANEAILISDVNNNIIAVNPALIEQTGYTKDELIGKNPRILSSGLTPKETYDEMWDSLNNAGHWQGELMDRNKNGQLYYKWTSISVILDTNGEIINYISTFMDISERKNNEEKIKYLAHHDPLTGLINRISLEERLEQSILSADREKQSVVIIFIDMDKFKDINDTKGHDIGDALLVEISKRLKNSVRESDIVARLGGDEFIIALTALDDKMLAVPIATFLLHILGQPYKLSNYTVHSTPSMGISIYPDNGDTVTSLLKHADTAMYYAKDKGRNNFQFFDDKMNQEISERIALEAELRHAIDEEQFILYYQPKVDSHNANIVGFEGLVRWQHPERGLVQPDKFIPICEELRLINPLGDWILNEACRQLAQWQTDGLSTISLSINLSLQQIQTRNFIPGITELINKYNIKPELLELEITESIAMHNPELIIEKLNALKKIGVKLAIDDFGTGYSSLMYLKKLPVDILKIDRAFVMDIDSDESDAQIVTATIALAHNLGLSVVAEGVEKQVHRDFLVEHKCDFLQGYFFSKPVPIAEATDYIFRNKEQKVQ